MTNEFWTRVAEDYMASYDATSKQVEKYAPRLAEILADAAADFMTDELPQREEDAKAASEDAYWEAKIDEHQEEK